MQTPLKLVRTRRGQTQLEVSAAVKIDNSQYGRIEKGATTTPAVARRIARYFGGDVTEHQILYPEDYVPELAAAIAAQESSAEEQEAS